MKTEHQNRIEKFMLLAGQEVPSKPQIPSEEVRKLRAKLILEEALETIKALGFALGTKDSVGLSVDIDNILFFNKQEPDLVGIADGCADISVVTIGTLSACGIQDQDILEIVDNANLSKFGLGSYKREDGKWIKPPDFVKPDIKIEEYLKGK